MIFNNIDLRLDLDMNFSLLDASDEMCELSKLRIYIIKKSLDLCNKNLDILIKELKYKKIQYNNSRLKEIVSILGIPEYQVDSNIDVSEINIIKETISSIYYELDSI